MRCAGCERVLQDIVLKVGGVSSAKADYAGSCLEVTFDPDKAGPEAIRAACAAAGYTLETWTPGSGRSKLLSQALALLALVLLILLSRKFGGLVKIPDITAAAGYGLIFAAGLLTGLHCVGMCGSFVIGYCAADAQAGRPALVSHLLYGGGKIISYAALGGVFGYLGSLFVITPFIGGVSLALAGAFLILYGLNTLRAFSFVGALLKRSAVPAGQAAPTSRGRPRGPLFAGLFSGLILGCGPLQAMYVLAAGNASAAQGAVMLALFGLGTLPLLLAFGLAARKLSGAMTRRFVQASGLILVALGAMMLHKGVLRAFFPAEVKQVHSCCHGAVSAANETGKELK